MKPETKTRQTRQRQAILEDLCSVKTHPSAYELYEMVKKRLPRISLGTVYRNLEFLSEKGVIRKLIHGGTEARFDGDRSTHYHVRCLRCNRVDDLCFGPIGVLEDFLRSLNTCEIVGYSLEFIGICPTCKGEKSKSLTVSKGAAPIRNDREVS
jgi:Fur family ferric uptake transcriptional regulator